MRLRQRTLNYNGIVAIYLMIGKRDSTSEPRDVSNGVEQLICLSPMTMGMSPLLLCVVIFALALDVTRLPYDLVRFTTIEVTAWPPKRFVALPHQCKTTNARALSDIAFGSNTPGPWMAWICLQLTSRPPMHNRGPSTIPVPSPRLSPCSLRYP